MPLDGTTFCLRAPKQLSLLLGDPDRNPAVILSLMEHRFASGTWRWIKKRESDDKGGFCLIGGLQELRLRLGVWQEEDTPRYLAWAIRGNRRKISRDKAFSTITGFNDLKTTRFTDVLRIIAKAKRLAEPR